MAHNSVKFLFNVCLLITTLKTVNSINCYQCSGTDSNDPFQCNEFLSSDNDLQVTDCSSIHDAQFCIKHVGRYEGVAIDCYQCNSSTTMECGDGLMHLDGGVLTSTSCEHVHNAQYCIKMTGSSLIFNTMSGKGTVETDLHCFNTGQANIDKSGGISTKRYCSSLDLGNFCNYVQQPGDKLEYRTCIYTCSTDGCNSGTSLKVPASILLIGLFLYKLFFL